MNDLVSDSYCTTRQAAKILGVSVRTAQLWVEKGVLKAWKTDGGHRRISMQSIRLFQGAKHDPGVDAGQTGGYAVPEDRLKVLVVEDDKLLLRMYRLRMEAWRLPIDILTAPNAIEGLLLVGRESPDLLITDLVMPELDGMTMVRTICQSPFRMGLEIVVVTGTSLAELEDADTLPEDVRLFQKPVPFAELKAICEELLAQRRLFAVV